MLQPNLFALSLIMFHSISGARVTRNTPINFSDHKSIANCSKEIATYIISTKTNFKDNCLYE